MSAGDRVETIAEGDSAGRGSGEIAPIYGGRIVVGDGARIAGIWFIPRRIRKSGHYLAKGCVADRRDIVGRGHDGLLGHSNVEAPRARDVLVIRNGDGDDFGSLLSVGMRLTAKITLAGDGEYGIRGAVPPFDIHLPAGRTARRIGERPQGEGTLDAFRGRLVARGRDYDRRG